jgi:hypothetical protein
MKKKGERERCKARRIVLNMYQPMCDLFSLLSLLLLLLVKIYLIDDDRSIVVLVAGRSPNAIIVPASQSFIWSLLLFPRIKLRCDNAIFAYTPLRKESVFV